MTWISRFLLLSLALFAASAGANRDTTFAWTASADWPSGTTVELCANGVCASGITAAQYTLSVPVSPGEAVEGQARAHAPIDWEPDPSENCDPQQSPPNCWISDWTTVSQTWPDVPGDLHVSTDEIGGSMALAFGGTHAALASGSNVSSLTSGSWSVSGSDRLLLGFAASGAGSPVVSNDVRWGGSGGTQFTALGAGLTFATYGAMRGFSLVAPAEQSATSYYSWPSNQDETAAGTILITGADQISPLGPVQTGTSDSTTLSINVASEPGDLVIACAWTQDINANNRTLSPSNGGTTLYTADPGNFEYMLIQSLVATGTSTTISVSASGPINGGIGMIGVAVKPASSGTQQTVTDSGSGVDAQIMNGGLSLSDIGVAADAPPVPGAMLDALDTGAGADALQVSLTLAVADSGSGAEMLSVLQQMLALASDAAGGSDTPNLSVGLSQADSAASVDGPLLLSVNIAASDAASAVDLLNKLEQLLITSSDTIIAVDGPSIHAGLLAFDLTAGAETQTISAGLSLPDLGSGSENQAIFAEFLLPDTGAGEETRSVSALLAIADAVAGADAAQRLGAIIKSALDAGAGSDGTSLSVTISNNDAMSGGEASVIAVQISSTDAGAGTDITDKLALIVKSLSDSGLGSESAELTITLRGFDTGDISDSSAVSTLLSAIDSAGGVDVAVSSDTSTQLIGICFAFASKSMEFTAKTRSITFNLIERDCHES